MKKMLFLRTSTPARGDGSGPTFHEGKAYWMSNASANYWLSEGVATEAPADMNAENDPPAEKRFAETVRIVPARPGRFNVLVGGVVANAQPLSAAAAETLRRDIIAGTAPPTSGPAAAPAESDPAPSQDDNAASDDGAGDGGDDSTEADDEDVVEDPTSDPGLGDPTYEVVHLGYGRYNVVASDGTVQNDAPLSKKAAAALADSLACQS